jgi:Inner membrane component of T3SS, cytoplasmic domain
MRVQEVSPRHFTTTTAPRNTVLLLRISRGQTRFPNRPVLTERYLIGAAPSCDLCLTGADVPPLHSVIVKEGRTYRWEAMMSRPAVRHNGRVCESFMLADGDRVSVGEVEFAVFIGKFTEIASELGVDPAAATVNAPVHEPPGLNDLDNTPATELVDRLERDLDWIEQFDRRRQLGADALLHAVRRRIAQPVADANAAPIEEFHLIERLERLAAQLAKCTTALERRVEEIATDHRSLSTTLADVLDAEGRLADRLESLLRGIVTTSDEPNRSAA